MKLATIEQIKKYKELPPKKWKKTDLDLRDRDRDDLMFHIYYDTVIKYLEARAERSAKVKDSVSVNLENSEA
jgi:hypothetical protein